MTIPARATVSYGLLVAVLFAAQAAYTIGGLERLWYEELAEGIRNPFWLDHRVVYDGTSTNVAWYGLVLLAYKVFGFSPYAAKYVRLALHVPFLVCSAVLLVRWLGVRRAWLPLVALGLSPTLLYFNNIGTSYGIDVELCPPIVLLATHASGRVLRFSCGAMAMVASLSYPPFLLYLPVLLLFYVWSNRAKSATVLIRDLSWMAGGFLAPFVVALAYLRDDRAFLSDPTVNGAGVFRGGGAALAADALDVSRAFAQLLHDLFLRGSSYNFALPHVEFSGTLGFLAAWGLVMGAIVVAWKSTPARFPLVLAGLLCLLSFVVPSLARNLPGLRRSTGFIAGCYIVVACVWAMPVSQARLSRVIVWIGRAACLLLVVHHLVVYVPNLRYLAEETRRMHDPWFNRFGSPRDSVRTWVEDWVLKGKPLDCQAMSDCRYSEIYPAVAGYLKWNGLGDRPVLATEPVSGRVIPLDTRYWETRTFRH